MRHRAADLAPLLGDLHRGDVEELDHGAVRALGPLGDHHPAVAGEVAYRKRAAPAERRPALRQVGGSTLRSEEHTSELQSLMRISYAVFCLIKKKVRKYHTVNLDKRNNILLSHNNSQHNSP